MVKLLDSGSVRRITHGMLIEEREVFRLLHPDDRTFWCGTLPGVFSEKPDVTYHSRHSAEHAYQGYLRWRESLKKGTAAPRTLILKTYKVQTIETSEEVVSPGTVPKHVLAIAWLAKHSNSWRGRRSASAAERDLSVIGGLLKNHGLGFAYLVGIEWQQHMDALQDQCLKDLGVVIGERVIGCRNAGDFFCLKSKYATAYTIDFDEVCAAIKEEYGFAIR